MSTTTSNFELIGMVTVLFNCEKYLSLFFECLGRQTDRNFIVIVVDNASSDASLSSAHALAQKHSVRCEFIPNTDNHGIAIGNNQGVEKARALGIQHVVLINNDIGCNNDLVANIREHAIVAGHRAWTCLAWYGDTERRWYGGGYLSYWLARGIHLDEQRSAAIRVPTAVSYAPTCLMYVHTSVFDQIGLMDPEYFVYYDDTDFCKRMMDAGIKLVYDPGISFKHYVGGSSGGELSPFFLRISTRNKFIYIRKNYGTPMRWAVVLVGLASKFAQLLDSRRRGPTLQGLGEALALLREKR